ncbi:MAG TPA: hypothetical protein V6D20_06400, partial [Candidatus Obscuribacterales bacterium]
AMHAVPELCTLYRSYARCTGAMHAVPELCTLYRSYARCRARGLAAQQSEAARLFNRLVLPSALNTATLHCYANAFYDEHTLVLCGTQGTLIASDYPLESGLLVEEPVEVPSTQPDLDTAHVALHALALVPIVPNA